MELKDVTSTKTQKKTFSNQSDSAVCIPPLSQAPWCASYPGVKLHGVLHTRESSFAVCIIPQSQAALWASYRGVKLHTAESESKSVRVSGSF